jgi:tetratricopeptide (TPR) repeat protein
MGIFNIFSSRSYESCEKRGDIFFNSNEFGPAKLDYEKALAQLERKTIPGSSHHHERLKGKINQSRKALALRHKTNAVNLIESGCNDDAAELLKLALELSDDTDLTMQIEHLLLDIKDQVILPTRDSAMEADEDMDEQDTGEEYFIALCSTLQGHVKDEYLGYGDSFKMGYIALNQGDFERASVLLAKSLEEHDTTVSYIHLELATAYLNLGDMDNAGALLVQFIDSYPGSVRAYEMLCDIFWEKRSYDKALELLQSCPDDLKISLPMNLLVGETLFQAEKYQEAESFYLEHMETNGWNEHIAKALARTYEALESKGKALEIYGKLINECKGCGGRVDPFVKQRYADMSYESGDISENIREIYLSLCQEDPLNQVRYFNRLSEIYAKCGYDEEAKRYLKFSKTAERQL